MIMLDWDLLKNLLIIAIFCSTITMAFIQKTKKFCRSSSCVTTYGLLINLILGFSFCQTFTNIDYIKSLWVGIFSFIGADTIYKNLEGKLASYTKLNTSENNEEDNVIGEISYE